MERTVYRTSVRALVEFIFRSGDIDNRISQTDTIRAMQAGTRMHQAVQNAAGPEYRSEVPLSFSASFLNYDLVLDGRADGIIEGNTGEFPAPDHDNEAVPAVPEVTAAIDEIKTTPTPLQKFETPVPVHLAQAKCYAYLYAKEQGLSAIGVQMTYVYVEPEERKRARSRRRKEAEGGADDFLWEERESGMIKRFRFAYLFSDLAAWFGGVIEEYRKWLDYLWHWKQVRTASIKELPFPFPYREGQKDLAAGVYRTIARGKTLFLQAPTGTGKTMAVLYPSVKAVGEGHADRIFYLTAKTETRAAATNAFRILQDEGLRMKYVLLTAKEKLCLNGEMVCDPEHCPAAKGHFDRINEAVYELLTREESFDRQTILDGAVKYKVCPFELSLDLTDWTDAIIGDYNYAFDPQVKLRRYFADGKSGEYLFLVDEAHNLVDRAREMYSASIVKEEFLQVSRILKPVTRRAERYLKSANKLLLEMKKQMEERFAALSHPVPARRESKAAPAAVGKLDLVLVQLQSVLDEILREHREFEDRQMVQELYFRINRFLLILEMVDENYTTYAQIRADGSFMLKLLCVNPAENLQRCYDSGVSAILFSATLLPVRYYISLLSKEESPYAMYAKSSFAEDQKLLLVAGDVSSKYSRRSPTEYARVAGYLQEMVGGRTGNYIAFFPSYRVLEDVLEAFKTLPQKDTSCGNAEVLIQRSRMTPDEREAFLAAFSEPHEGSLLAFCVLGGIFSEGIDLTGEQLIGAAIYGTGIPQINAELTLIQEYYDKQEGTDGFAYAYQYPGMNKVQQAAGRVIRTIHDRGVILLLDDRFLRADYRALFPREWANYQVTTAERVQGQIARFWKAQGPRPPQADGAPAQNSD